MQFLLKTVNRIRLEDILKKSKISYEGGWGVGGKKDRYQKRHLG